MKRSWWLPFILLALPLVLIATTGFTAPAPQATSELQLQAQATPTPSAKPTVAPVPVGQTRRDRDWDNDIEALLFGRRTASSDLVGGLGGIAFNPKDCLRCHENASGVEGQIFYGPEFKDFAKNQWAEMLSNPETKVPVRDYDFVTAHEKRVDLTLGVFPEQQVKQNP